MATIKLDLTDERARDVIHALSVHARDLAGTGRKENLEKVKRLDKLRHELEAATDQAA